MHLHVSGAYTWRIIPVGKYFETLIYKPYKGHLEGERLQLGEFRSPYLLTTYFWEDPPSTPPLRIPVANEGV